MVRLVLTALVLAWTLLRLPLALARRALLLRRPGWVRLELDGAIDELPTRRAWAASLGLAPPPRPSLVGIRRLVDAVVADRRVLGLVVTLRGLDAGAATATALREALAKVRASGRTLLVELPVGGATRELLVASSASRIVAGPTSSLAALGFSSESRYVRRLLDRVGVVPDVIARGEFKSAGETFVRDAMSAEQRTQVGAILDELHAELVGALATGRGVAEDAARALVDEGPYLAEEARERGLVDAVAYEDAVPRLLDPASARPPRVVSAGAYLAARAPLFPARRRAIGVVRVRGAIVSRAPFAIGRLAVDDAIIGALRVARELPELAAVVLLVDSPGGSALASDRIHHEVERLAEKKPVVACFGDVAASGGYYVAAGASRIVAQPTTITGSIGVVAARFVVAPLLDRLGVAVERVARGARAGMGSPARALTEDERAALEREIDGVYRAFLGVVARGRKRTVDEIEPLARGRVWTGRAAKDAGLVDVLGGLDVALAEARALAGERGRGAEPVEIVPPRTPPRPPELPAPLVDALGRLAGPGALDAAALALSTRADRVLVYAPDLALAP